MVFSGWARWRHAFTIYRFHMQYHTTCFKTSGRVGCVTSQHNCMFVSSDFSNFVCFGFAHQRYCWRGKVEMVRALTRASVMDWHTKTHNTTQLVRNYCVCVMLCFACFGRLAVNENPCSQQQTLIFHQKNMYKLMQ